MSFVLLDEESDQLEPKKASFGEKFKREVKETPHKYATKGAAALSVPLGLAGDIGQLFNDFIAGPIYAGISGKKAAPYHKTLLGKALPTSQEVEKDIHRLAPITKPRTQAEKEINDIVGTTSSLLIPGAQAKVGRFAKTSPLTRALFKSIGATVLGKEIEDLTGSKEKGNKAKAGALLSMAFLDRQGAGKYISSIYKIAEDALTKANNPSVNAAVLTSKLNNTKSKLSKGTLAPSEAAVVNDIDKALAHVQNGQIPVENLWGISRSLNENKLLAMRGAANKQGRLRAKAFYDSVIKDVNSELGKYGKTNPQFGVPFQEAQEGFGALARSHFLENWVKENISYNPASSGLLHLFGGGIGALVGKGANLSAQGAAVPAATYQAVKLLYRIKNSGALRRYYMTALQGAAKENAQVFNRAVKKLDEELQKMDKKNPSFELLD